MGHDQVVQLGFPPRRIDLITGLTALEFESSWNHRVEGELDRIKVAYLSRDDFVRNKLAVGLPKDLADAAAVSDAEFSSSDDGR